ncbi:hypothetical protein BY996DRAFT_6938786 [Phakopsora pachyrhizi]|nr:hypothetical protein BY996DRAFT_6938786 [Phakopsora pachyrhizi]
MVQLKIKPSEANSAKLNLVEKISDIIKILTQVKLQQYATENTIRASQLELKLEFRLRNSDVSIKIVEKLLIDALQDAIVKGESKNDAILPFVISVLEYLLECHLVDFDLYYTIFQNPKALDWLGEVIWKSYLNSQEFNPFFLSTDLQQYIRTHPSTYGIHLILSYLKPEAWKYIVFRFLEKLLKSYKSPTGLIDLRIGFLNKALESLKVKAPKIDFFLNEFNGKTTLEEFPEFTAGDFTRAFLCQSICDRFFFHIFLYHILKCHEKYGDGEYFQRVAERIGVFESVFNVFIGKLELIQAISFSGFRFNPGWNGDINIYNMIEDVDTDLRRPKSKFGCISLILLEKRILNEFTKQEILETWSIWKKKITSSSISLKDKTQKHHNFMAQIENSSHREIEYKWKNSKLFKEIWSQLEEQIQPEPEALKLINFMDDLVAKLEREHHSRSPLNYLRQQLKSWWNAN